MQSKEKGKSRNKGCMHIPLSTFPQSSQQTRIYDSMLVYPSFNSGIYCVHLFSAVLVMGSTDAQMGPGSVKAGRRVSRFAN